MLIEPKSGAANLEQPVKINVNTLVSLDKAFTLIKMVLRDKGDRC